MSYQEFMLDSARAAYFKNWAEKNNYEILNSSSADFPAIHSYAKDMQGIVVPDPRGIPNLVLVVRQLN